MSKIKESYFNYLIRKIGLENDTLMTSSLWAMFCMPFYILVDFDSNRYEDGKQLRRDLAFERPSTRGALSREMPDDCSMLEMLVALAARMSLTIDHTPSSCFWHMFDNLDISDPTDPEEVEEAMRILRDREYNYDGSGGGLFPVDSPNSDFRDIEIYKQMNEYLIENKYY